jgi:hypothetical protein
VKGREKTSEVIERGMNKTVLKEETEEGKGGERRGIERKTTETNIEERIGGR